MTLNAAVTGTSTPFKYLWAADSPTASGVFSAATQPLTTFSPVVADAAGGTTAAFTLTVTNACGAAAKAKAIVTVADAGPAAKEIIQVIPPMTVNSGEWGLFAEQFAGLSAGLSGGLRSNHSWLRCLHGDACCWALRNRGSLCVFVDTCCQAHIGDHMPQ